MNVDCPRTRLSLAPTRVNTRSHTPIVAPTSRHEAPHLRQQHDQPDLPEDRALPRHVRARENDEPCLLGEPTSFGMNLSRGIIRSTTG
jgi:hypothetical protein